MSISNVSELVSLPEDVASGQKDAGSSLVPRGGFLRVALRFPLIAANKSLNLDKQRTYETFETLTQRESDRNRERSREKE